MSAEMSEAQGAMQELLLRGHLMMIAVREAVASGAVFDAMSEGERAELRAYVGAMMAALPAPSLEVRP